MKIQKLIFSLTIILITLNSFTLANKNNDFATFECEPFRQFNKTMQAELQLNNEQFEVLLNLNRKYWSARRNILNNADKIGKNTALLASWDKWQMELSNHLAKPQMERLMQWQSDVDLLSEVPY